MGTGLCVWTEGGVQPSRGMNEVLSACRGKKRCEQCTSTQVQVKLQRGNRVERHSLFCTAVNGVATDAAAVLHNAAL